jgi:hypothetical protein
MVDTFVKVREMYEPKGRKEIKQRIVHELPVLRVF